MSIKAINEIVEICERMGARFGISWRFVDVAASDNGDTESGNDLTIGEPGITITGFRTGDTPVILYNRKISYRFSA